MEPGELTSGSERAGFWQVPDPMFDSTPAPAVTQEQSPDQAHGLPPEPMQTSSSMLNFESPSASPPESTVELPVESADAQAQELTAEPAPETVPESYAEQTHGSPPEISSTAVPQEDAQYASLTYSPVGGVTIIGDSVTLGARDRLMEIITDSYVDTVGNRQIWQG
jgi:hypothetical protein